MTIPLVMLAILAAVGGFVGIPEVMIPRMQTALGHFLRPVFAGGEKTVAEIPASTEWMLMGLSTALALAMVLICLVKIQ